RLTRRPAGLPTAQCLRSAIVSKGAGRSKARSTAKAKSDGGLPAGLVIVMPPFIALSTMNEGQERFAYICLGRHFRTRKSESL
ncbi:hypothetical protein, partial [Pseudomonas fluorescens]|uniref:hypothetical protein n=1 Tax=Pseudomonas fluorescens TaxID=294 RepID=UPI001F169E62